MKVFSFEEDKDNNIDEDTSELLINKLIKYAQVKKESEGISATADIIKQRDKLKEQLKEEFKKEDDKETSDNTDEENNEDTTEDTDTTENTEDTETTEDTDTNDKEENKDTDDTKEDTDADKDKDNEKDTDNKASSTDNEEDPTEHANSTDSLRAIIGSGLKSAKSTNTANTTNTSNKETNKKESKEEDKDPLSLDHYRDKTKPLSFIKQYKLSYESYVYSLTKRKPLSFEEIPVAYTKEAIIEALNKIISLCQGYSNLTNKIIEKRLNGLKQINESSSIISLAYKNDKLHLNNKVVEDRDLLVKIVNSVESEVVKSSNLIHRYMKTASVIVKSLITNSYKQLETILTSNDYEHSKEDGSYVYKDILPGFIQSHITDYKFNSYMDVDISQVSSYKVITLKQNTIAALNTVQISQDKDISKIISNMDNLIIEVSLNLDNAKTIALTLNNQAEEIKKTVYDIEHGVVENYTEIGIEKKIDELLRLKLSIDYIKMNVDIALDYLTNLVVFLGLICDINN